MHNLPISISQIKDAIPHRYPFLLVDRVLELHEDNIVAIKNVTVNEPQFNGHFPEVPVFPGVLQIEAMAQAAGLIIALNGEFDKDLEIAFLAGVDEAKFKRVVSPGDQLVLKAKILAKKRGVSRFLATATVDGELASTAIIVMVVKPKA